MMSNKATLLVLLTWVCLLSVGCSGLDNLNAPANASSKLKENLNHSKITLKVALWDSATAEYWQLRTDHEFKQIMPDVEVSWEAYHNDIEYYEVMSMLATANALPDIMMLKPNYLEKFKQYALPLDDMEYTTRNTYANAYEIDGNVIAVPHISYYELMFYHPSIFEELNLKVPSTWSQFLEVLTTIKAHGKYIPYAMGGKDVWPNYPFNELMPHILSDDENYLSSIAEMDSPFSQGTPFYNAYSKITELYQADVMGDNPLRVSWEQASDKFEQKQAAIIGSGQWYLGNYHKAVGFLDDIAVFPLPYRDSEEEPLKIMVFVDNFYMINKQSQHLEAAKVLMEWLNNPEVYGEFYEEFQHGFIIPTYEGIEEQSAVARRLYRDLPEPFIYKPGNAQYSELVDTVKWDWKAIGQEVMAYGEFASLAVEWNEKWAVARQSLDEEH